MIIPFGLISPQFKVEKRPNILLILADDLGYGDLSMTGHPVINTPNIDGLARSGVFATDFYVNPACTASRYALLTGKYSARSGFDWVLNPDSPRYIHPGETTLAEALKSGGYRTGIFGKWHLGFPNAKNKFEKKSLPLEHGFDRYVGIPYSNDMQPPNYPDLPLFEGPVKQGDYFDDYHLIAKNPDLTKIGKLLTDAAINFMKQPSESPFFCYFPIPMPHTPLNPDSEHAGKSARGAYGDVVQEIDSHIGKLLTYLKRSGKDSNTLVVFLSDNGPWILQGLKGGSSGLFKDGKGSTWEGGVRVPAIFNWPGRLPKGVRYHSPLAHIDVAPTICEAAGVKMPGRHDGESVLSELKTGKDVPDRNILLFGVGQKLFAMRRGSWKIHVDTYSQVSKYDGVVPLLFNVTIDPSEATNTAKSNPDLLNQLLNVIKNADKAVKDEGTLWR